MWEYPAKPISLPIDVFSFHFDPARGEHEAASEAVIKIRPEFVGKLNGFALWHTIEYDEMRTVNAGLLTKPVANKSLNWHRDYKQAVHILDRVYEIDERNKDSLKFVCKLAFSEREGKFRINFEINEQ